jgi:pyruvoyl-dependent arginine decarboxylase (PvlArgDC)
LLKRGGRVGKETLGSPVRSPVKLARSTSPKPGRRRAADLGAAINLDPESFCTLTESATNQKRGRRYRNFIVKIGETMDKRVGHLEQINER